MQKSYNLLLALLLIISLYHSTKAQIPGAYNTTLYSIDFSTTDPNDLSFLAKDLQEYNHFFFSEYHRSELAILQHQKFIQFLVENHRLDKIIMERPYAYGYLLSEYLKTGDEQILQLATATHWSMDKARIHGKISMDTYRLFQWLYEYQQSQGITIEVVGIDLNQTLNGTIELAAIKYFIDKYSINHLFPRSYPELTELSEKESLTMGRVKRWHRRFWYELIRTPTEIPSDMENDMRVLEQLSEAVLDMVIYKRSTRKKSREHRESTMAQNFMNNVAPDDIVYGQFGAGHIALDTLHGGFVGFATLLQAVPQYRNLSLSIGLHCLGCKLGEDNTTSNFYPNCQDGSGYCFQDELWDFEVPEEYKQRLIEELNGQSMAMDVREISFRKNKDELQAFQYYFFLF